MIALAHIVHPVQVGAVSDLFVAQPITFATMHMAREFSAGRTHVELHAVQYADEERLHLPASFTRTCDLTRSVGDVADFRKKRKLALIKDILDSLYGATAADYLIYTNVDIALQPYFYDMVAALIARGHDAVIINRRTISGRYQRIEEIPLMYAEIGEKHPGWDCFVFARALYPKFRLGNACIGTDWIGRMMISNLAPLANDFMVFNDLHATFHIGDERAWVCNEFLDYSQHNKNECRKTLEEFDQTYGPFDRQGLPGKFLGRFSE
jgi:hypothetical protein